MKRALLGVNRLWWLGGAVLVLILAVALVRQQRPSPVTAPVVAVTPRNQEAVAALGRLEPAGDVRLLAAPPAASAVAPVSPSCWWKKATA